MRTVWLLLQTSVARWKNRKHIVFVIVLMLAMVSTICYVREQEMEEVEGSKIGLGVAVEDISAYAELLLQYFNENEIFLQYVELIEAEEQKLKEVLEQGKLDAYLVIPENFAESMIEMENLPIKARVSMASPTKALILRHVMEAYENYIEAVEVNCTALYRYMKESGFAQKELDAANMEISLELIFTALGKDTMFRNHMVETEKKEVLSLVEHYQYTGVYFILLFLFIPAGLHLIALRQNGLTNRLKAVNIPIGSVVVAVGLPYLLLAAVLLGGVCYIKGSPDRMGEAFLLVFPWLLAALLLGVVSKENKRYLFVCSMVLVCLAVVGGSLIPEEFLPDSFRTVAAWMPNRNFTYVMGGVTP